MAKGIIKELIIVLILCLSIILILGILLYKYVPMSKTLPNEVAYVTPETVKKELLDTSSLDESQIVMTYEVNSDDLKNYTRIQDYKPGKANPFSSYETSSSSTESGSSNSNSSNGTSSNSSSNSNGNSNSNSTQNSNNNGTTTSGGKFFKDKGTK